MTKHADRDHSEPYWPPVSRAEYDKPATHPCEGCGTQTAELVCRDCWGTNDDPRWCRDCNGVCKGLPTCSPMRQDNATREPRVRFPLDDGDTGASLLPVAPTGTLLRCPVCPAALADTRGGRLDHCDDGTHHYVPAQPADERTDGNRRGPDGYRCCKHCADDHVHDVETDAHSGPCQTCDDPGAMLRELASRLERALAVERAKVARVESVVAGKAGGFAQSIRAALADSQPEVEPEATAPNPTGCPICNGEPKKFAWSAGEWMRMCRRHESKCFTTAPQAAP